MVNFTNGRNLIYRNIPWSGSSLLNHPDFMHSFKEDELIELDNILQKIKKNNLLNEQISINNPILIKKFKHIKNILQNGIGCVLFKNNFYFDKYTLTDLKSLFYIISSYIGTPISQSNSGEKLMDIKFDESKAGTIKDRAPYNKNDAYFHTDTCDILGMFCLNTAYRGGDSLLASSLYVHNYIIDKYPNIIEHLYCLQEYHFPQWEHSEIKVAKAPIFSVKQGYFSSHYIRGRINLSKNKNIRKKQKYALDTLDKVIEDKKIHLQFKLNKKDMIFFNNFLTYHGRKAFIDSIELNKVRHFLRVWLSDSEGRPLSKDFDYFYKTDSDGIRGGIKQFK